MKKISSKMKILTLVAVVCSFLLLPAISSAGEVELGTVEFGPGTKVKTFDLGTNAMSVMGAPALKSLSISVQNGTKRGKDRVSSAVVSLNGKEMFVQNNFSQNVSSLIGELDVVDPSMASVELKVKINGKKSARLSITVKAIYEEVSVPAEWYCPSTVPPTFGMGTTDTPPPLDLCPIGWVLMGGF